MNCIGIIGGLGPEPTVDYYRIIIETYRKQVGTDHTPEMILYSVDLQAFLGMMETQSKEKIVNWFVDGIGRLQRAGADFGLIAAVTPHMFFDEIHRHSPIPLLSVVEETAKAVSAAGLRRVGLWGTKYTMHDDFFHLGLSRMDVETVIPTDQEQETIHGKLIDELQFGRIVTQTKRYFLELVQMMRDRDHIEGLILGCTELPLILSDESLDIPLFNATRIHARSAVEYCLSEQDW